MSSLFSLDNILLNESSTINKSINIDNIGYADIELKNYSFVQEGYDFILEIGRDYMNAEKVFYTEVLGSYGDDEIITESFDGFFNKIKDIIRKFIEWIKKIFKEFVVKINSLFSSEKYIKKNQKLLNKFESQDEFEFNGYEFTYIESSNVPQANACEIFDSASNFNNGITQSLTGNKGVNWNSYKTVVNNMNIEDDTTSTIRDNITTTLNNNLDTMTDELNDHDDLLDKFRALVINKSNDKIDSSDFPNELFMIFRNGEDTPSDITIDSTYVMEAYRRFDKYKDVVKAIEKNQKAIIKDYEALEKYLDKFIKLNKEGKSQKISSDLSSSNDFVSRQINYIGGNELNDLQVFNTSTYDKLRNYYKKWSTIVNQMCTIHTQAFTAKLEAAKDCFKQDKKILYKALQQIVKRSNKPGF